MLRRSQHGLTKERLVRGTPRRARLVVAIAAAGLLLPAVPAQAANTGTVVAWGANAFGQLGNGTTTSHLTAGPVSRLTAVEELGGGRNFALALTGGAVWSWGANESGQLGDGTQTNRTSPVAVTFTAPAPTIVEVSSGHYSSFAADSAGNAWSWGRNNNGQLGDGTTMKRSRPVRIASLSSVHLLSGGRDHSLALKNDGTVWAWGSNAFGQLGDGTTTRRLTPVQVQGLPSAAIQIAAGREHSLALLSDGTVWAWGSNVYGQLGDGTKTNRTRAVRVTGLTGITDVETGAHHSLALRSTGTVAAWGRNYRGEIGDGTTTIRTTPITVPGLAGVVSIAAGRDHTLAVLGDGTMRAWGFNTNGEIGDGTLTTRKSPVVVPGVSSAVLAEGGEDYSIAVVR